MDRFHHAGHSWTLAAVATLSVATFSCGGGGGGGGGAPETLYVSISYAEAARLFRASTIHPVLTGFNGHSPQCSLLSGSPPAGMTLLPDCSVTGTPTHVGPANFVVHLGAAGVSNQLDWPLGLGVMGPSAEFVDQSPTFYVGDAVDVGPSGDFWDPQAGETVTYEVASGALPPGLALDAGTGHLHGTVANAAGDYSYSIKVTVEHGSQVAAVEGSSVLAHVIVPQFSYPDRNGLFGDACFVSVPFSVSPRLPVPGASYTFALTGTLPAGLALDPATGVISGTATTLFESGCYGVAATITVSGEAPYVDTTCARIGVVRPLDFRYSSPPFPLTPQLTFFTSMPDLTKTFAMMPGCAFVPGVTLDATTGVVSGTPPATGPLVTTTPCGVRMNATNDGVPFTVDAYFW